MNYVYIAKCSDDTFYTGWTTDTKKREKTHNLGKGAKYTRSRLPVKIVYVEEFETKTDVLKRERFIKKLTRTQKEKLISGYNTVEILENNGIL